ncbi:MAG: fosfomycin resistance glutathione transferase [Coriobacteriia bacterium]|nr:fosfomycin resistance glutathione transferase [Coriobacteriia bacterium]
MLRGLNHITLAVSDLQASIVFYQELLGMKLRAKWDRGAYFECDDLWLCLSIDDGRLSVNPEEDVRPKTGDYTHYAFSIVAEEFDYFVLKLEQAGVTPWKGNSSEGKSYYFLDPDGHRLEVHVGGLAARLESCRQEPYDGMVFY